MIYKIVKNIYVENKLVKSIIICTAELSNNDYNDVMKVINKRNEEYKAKYGVFDIIVVFDIIRVFTKGINDTIKLIGMQ